VRVLWPTVKLVLAAGLVLLVLASIARADVGDELQPLGGVPEGACQTVTATATGGGKSVKAVVRDAVEKGAVAEADGTRYEQVYDDAKRTWRKLGGGRRRELQAVLKQLETFARNGTLTTTRMPVLFFQLEQNATWWAKNAPPPPPKPAARPCAGGTGVGGARVIEREIVLQWYAGQGLQVMQLATAGRANALVKACLEANPNLKCDQDRVRTAMDGLLLTSATRDGARAWEAYFAFGGGAPPWVSGLWQGTAMQALARGTQVLGDPKYLEAAKEGLGVFEHNAPSGVRVKAGSGVHYLGYSFNRQLRIYNQFLQALVGLYDVAEIGKDERARRLFDEGDRRARQEVPTSDTGAWSRYSANGNESDLGYHQLLRDFLRSMCDRTKATVYCATADRFQGYLKAKPGVKFLGGTPTNVRFYVTKIGCVTLTVTKNGRRVATVTRVLGRGAQGLAWSPPGKGTYRVQVSAKDLASNVGTATKTVTIR
jgi:hypothetical protein